MEGGSDISLRDSFERIRTQAERLAGKPGDMPRRVAVLHSIWRDSRGNHPFPEVALHGALWAYRFYDRRGTVSELITYRYLYSSRERVRRKAMLATFSDGFKVANRSVFVDTFTNYCFTKRFGDRAGAEAIIPSELLEALNRVHHAARSDKPLSRAQRATLFETALRFEQERTVGPKVREEVGRFDCPILTRLVLKPLVRFRYFPRGSYMLFRNFGNTDERIEKAIRSYELAERVGWERVSEAIDRYGVVQPAALAAAQGSLALAGER